MLWVYLKSLLHVIGMDFAKALGFPVYVDPADGEPDNYGTPQWFRLRILGLAKWIDPNFRPVHGTKAALKTIYRFVWGGYAALYRLWKIRRKLSKIAGYKIKTDEMATDFLKFLARRLEEQEDHRS